MNHFLKLEKPEDFSKIFNSLTIFKNDNFELFQSLFINNEVITFEGSILETLKEFEIVENDNQKWRSDLRVLYINNVIIFTDNFYSTNVKRVFPLSLDESLHLANKIDIEWGKSVLDIGTGSGIYAILAAKKTNRVVAIDINERALAFARFNAKLNRVFEKIEFRKVDINETDLNEKFDLVISNPAIIPTPSNSKFFIHSDGGPLGTSMSYGIIEKIPKLVKRNGKLQIFCTSLSDINGNLDIVQFISDNFSKSQYKFCFTELYQPSLEIFPNLVDSFKHEHNHEDFSLRLKGLNYTNLHYLYLEVFFDKTFDIEFNFDFEGFELSKYSGSWLGRLKRLFMIFFDDVSEEKEKLTDPVGNNLR
jgi:tRNA1(Val) A37 N6-methylase TrmN6